LPATPPYWPSLDRLGLTQAIGGLALGLIALFSSYDHLTVAGPTFPIPQRWVYPSSLPRWRSFLSNLFNTARHLGATLNWRRDPGYELRKMLHEQRMKQLESDILRVRSDSERSKERTKLIENETEQIKKETGQL
jgi:hypothetical protein